MHLCYTQNKNQWPNLAFFDSLDRDTISSGLVGGDIRIPELPVSKKLPQHVMVIEILGIAEIRGLATGDPAPLPLTVLILIPVLVVVIVIGVVLLLLDPQLRRILLLLLLHLRVTVTRRRRILLGGGVVPTGAADLGGGKARAHVVNRGREGEFSSFRGFEGLDVNTWRVL